MYFQIDKFKKEVIPMTKKILFRLTVLLTLFSIFMLSCSSNSSTDDVSQSDMATEESAGMGDMMEGMPPQEARDMGELDLGEKIIESATLSYETLNFENTLEFVNQQIDSHGAEVEFSSRWQSTSSYGFIGEHISMTLRVPQERLHPFIEVLNNYEDLVIQHQDLQKSDVTKVYRDNETRIEILKEEEAVLREMLQEQGSLEEILQIRTRLSEIVTQREIYENENRAYDEQIAFSTVQLEIQQTDRANTRDTRGFWDRITNAVTDSFYRFIAVSQNLVISFIYLIPYLVIIGIIALIVYQVVRRRRKQK